MTVPSTGFFLRNRIVFRPNHAKNTKDDCFMFFSCRQLRCSTGSSFSGFLYPTYCIILHYAYQSCIALVNSESGKAKIGQDGDAAILSDPGS